MLNRVTMQGRLTADPVLKSANDITLCHFGIACDRDRPDASGNRQTDFFECTAWRQTAEHVAKYYHKGDMILICGRLQSRSWQDPSDKKTKKLWEIIAEEVWFPSSRKESGKTASTGPAPIFADEPEDAGGELPF